MVVRRRRGGRWVWALLATALALFILFPQTRNRPLSLVEAPFVWVSSKLVEVADGIGHWADDNWKSYIALGDVHEENLRLQARLAEVRNERNSYRDAAYRLAGLEAAAGLARHHRGGTVARVVGGDATHWFQAFLVDRGQFDGIKSGDAVISPQGVVGRVAKATHTTAQVLAVHNRGTVIPVRVERTRHAGVLIGGLRPSALRPLSVKEREAVAGVPLIAEMRYVHRSADVLPGDVVVTSGLSGTFPAGLPVGTVVRVVREKTDAFLKIYVSPRVRFDTLEEVVIVASGEPMTLEPESAAAPEPPASPMPVEDGS